MKKKKVMAMIAAMSLTAVIGVGGTLAYLSAQTDVVNNTFTIGDGYITDDDDHQGIFIDEEDVDKSTEGKDRDTENKYTGMVPSKSYTKDPLVHMVGGSIESYVFVNVSGLGDLKAQHINVYYKDANGVLQQGVDTTDYKPIQVDDNGDGLYLYIGGNYNMAGKEYVVDVSKETKGTPCDLDNVFDVVMMDDTVDSDEFAEINLDEKAIKVQAAAVQYSEKMSSYQDALATLPKGWYTATAE